MADRTIAKYNLSYFDPVYTEGAYDMPMLAGEDYAPKEIIPFNYALNTKKRATGIHFFIDDYQFERVWNDPKRYVEALRKFDCVLTPDFSLYTDMPRAMMIYNTYRSRLIGAIMQDAGLKVIPTVSWAREDSFEFCFDGLPGNATLAISTIGTGYSDESKRLLENGITAMIDRLSPKRILVYGRCTYAFPDEIEICRFDNERLVFLKSIGVKNDEA